MHAAVWACLTLCCLYPLKLKLGKIATNTCSWMFVQSHVFLETCSPKTGQIWKEVFRKIWSIDSLHQLLHWISWDYNNSHVIDYNIILFPNAWNLRHGHLKWQLPGRTKGLKCGPSNGSIYSACVKVSRVENRNVLGLLHMDCVFLSLIVFS